MATPPRSIAVREANAPDSLPIGVRAVETITEPGMVTPHLLVTRWSLSMVAGPPDQTSRPPFRARGASGRGCGTVAGAATVAAHDDCSRCHPHRDPGGRAGRRARRAAPPRVQPGRPGPGGGPGDVRRASLGGE